MPAGGNPLALVVIDLSVDDGNTWTRIASDNSPRSPTDAESVSFRFSSAGTAILRGTATDSQGLSGNATLTLAIAKADQSGVSISPSAASATAGQTLLFTASGGATGNYAWGGSASGAGSSTTVAFPAPGQLHAHVIDLGSPGYNPSPAASATVNVQPAFYTLTLLSSPGGTVLREQSLRAQRGGERRRDRCARKQLCRLDGGPHRGVVHDGSRDEFEAPRSLKRG